MYSIKFLWYNYDSKHGEDCFYPAKYKHFESFVEMIKWLRTNKLFLCSDEQVILRGNKEIKCIPYWLK